MKSTTFFLWNLHQNLLLVNSAWVYRDIFLCKDKAFLQDCFNCFHHVFSIECRCCKTQLETHFLECKLHFVTLELLFRSLFVTFVRQQYDWDCFGESWNFHLFSDFFEPNIQIVQDFCIFLRKITNYSTRQSVIIKSTAYFRLFLLTCDVPHLELHSNRLVFVFDLNTFERKIYSKSSFILVAKLISHYLVDQRCFTNCHRSYK